MIDEEFQYAVQVINGFKSYGVQNLFNGLNMNVKSGHIYGLLGPSGCGKSTLLQCILGTISLDSGEINVKAGSLKDVGYMPQNLCLEGTLTIKESFEYYGTLYKMDKKNIDIKVDELNTFLQLPNLNSLIKDISGGQSRRVSLAICLLHNPKLIILDEPTVGIDPLLRQEIWKGLQAMAEQEQTTIIITTHYIEEANLANCIGLMRNGVLIEEGSPQDIISKHEADSLESAFLTLCSKQDSNEAPTILLQDIHKKDKNPSNNFAKFDKSIDFIRVKALLRKNFQALCRDYWLIFSVLLLPVIQTCNFCYGVGGSINGMEVAIKNDEINLSHCQYLNSNGCIFDKNTSRQSMSCVAINYLSSLNYTLVEVKDRYTGEKLVDNSKFVAFIHFPKNYTQDLTTFIDDPNSYDTQSQSYMHFAKHNMLLKNQIIMDVTNSMRYLLRKTLNSCSVNSKVAGLPMEFNTVYGKEVKYHINSTVSIFLAMGAFYFSSIYSVSVMLSERMDGILGRSIFAGVTIIELIISMFCISNILIVAQTSLSVFITYIIFGNPIKVSSGLFIYAVLILFMSWIGFLFGLLAAGITPNKAGGVHIMNGWALSQMLLSGGIWPMDAQVQLLRSVSELLPMRVAGKTMTDITLKGWMWDHPSVITGTIATFAHVIILILVLIFLTKVKKNMWVLQK